MEDGGERGSSGGVEVRRKSRVGSGDSQRRKRSRRRMWVTQGGEMLVVVRERRNRGEKREGGKKKKIQMLSHLKNSLFGASSLMCRCLSVSQEGIKGFIRCRQSC